MIFESSEKHLSKAPDMNKNHKYSKLLGLNFLIRKVHAIPTQDIFHFRIGSILTLTFSSFLGLYLYRKNIQQEYETSSSISKMTFDPPFDAGTQFYQTHGRNEPTFHLSMYTRIPEREFDVYYRLHRCYMHGHYDHTKEILIPKKKNGRDGYDIITPFYYYKVLYPDVFFSLNVNGKPEKKLKSERAGIAVNRGW